MINNKNNLSDIIMPAKRWFIVGIITVLLSPLFFMLSISWMKFDFTQTSSIGDTIGGITSPIVGLLSAILVFYALIAQVKANQLVQDQISQQNIKEQLQSESNEINQLYNNLKSSIDNLSIEPV